MAKATGKGRAGTGGAAPRGGKRGRGAAGREMVVCVLNEPEYLHDVLTAFVEAGCTTATVLESQGMGRIISQDVPIFAGFRHLFAGSKPYNYTIFAVVDDAALVQRLVRVVRDVLSEVQEEAKGILFTVPVSSFARLSED